MLRMAIAGGVGIAGLFKFKYGLPMKAPCRNTKVLINHLYYRY